MAVTVKIPDEFKKWRTGLDHFTLADADTVLWDQANDYAFSETQRRVHVLSGDLKRSGRQDKAQIDGLTLIGGFTYGGVPGQFHKIVNYAEYELARGGTHDFITPSVVAFRRRYEEAILEIAIRAVKRSVGG